MGTERLLVIGNGMAGLKLLEELQATAAHRFAITAVGAEPEPAYNRVLLSSLLAGEIAADDARLKPRAWYQASGIDLVTGDGVVALDAGQRTATLQSGRRIAFDRCVLATGSDPIRLPVPGANLDGVMTFRTFADVAHLEAAARAGARVVVIGGGLLGIEAAYGLARAGVAVTLLHIMDRLMERQLDAEAAALLKSAIEAKGIEVLLQADTARIVGKTRVGAIELKDGRTLACGLVVMGVGIRPNTALAAAAGLSVKRGIVVDDRLATSHPGIHALGECAEHRGVAYGLVEPAYEQACVLAGALTGSKTRYAGSVLATNLKVSGVPVFSAGDFEGTNGETIVMRDAGRGTYRKLVIADDRLTGIVMVGETTDALWYLDLIRSRTPIGPLRAHLAFGRAFAEAA